MHLHERIALALGWTEQDVTSFSLPTLREIVRPVNPSLASEITAEMYGLHARAHTCLRRRRSSRREHYDRRPGK